MAVRPGRKRPEKILVAMHKLSGGSTELLKYEDIVVKAFQMFPDEFALRGYPQFPDSSDIHKPLYGILKKRALVRSGQKQFGLTPRGIEAAEGLIHRAGASLNDVRMSQRLTRDIEAELERMLKSDAFQLFSAGDRGRILDTDFYAFAGCTVRTARNDFIGRLAASTAAIDVACKFSHPDKVTAETLRELRAFLKRRFAKEIGWKVRTPRARLQD